MSLITLNIPIITGCEKTVTFYPKVLELNDSYKQITGSRNKTTTWKVSSALTPYATIQNWLDYLVSFDGATEFLIKLSDDLGTHIFYCDNATIEYTTHLKGQLVLELTESESSDCIELTTLIDTTNLLSRLNSAFSFITTYTTSDNFMFLSSDKYLPPNAMHDVEGRGDYFPSVSGTSEGIFLTIVALMDYYRVSGNSSALTTAQNIYSGAIDVAYKGQTPPNPANSARFLPHWLYTVKGSTKLKGLKQEPNFLNGGYYQSVTFTATGTALQYSTNLGSDLADVYNVYSSNGQLLWKYIYSPLISGTKFTIVYWINQDNKKCVYTTQGTISKSTNDTGKSPGYVLMQIPSGYTFTSPANIIYTTYQGTAAKNTCIEGFPFWRQCLSNEFNHALDVSAWAYEAYRKLYLATGNNTYNLAAEATRISTLAALNIQNDSFVFKLDTETTEPFSVAGTQLIKINGKTGSAIRNVSGELVITHDYSVPTNYGQLELQNFVVSAVWARATVLQTNATSSIANILFWGVSTQQDAGDFTGTYYAPVAYTANTTLNKELAYADFVKLDNPSVIWHPTKADTPCYTYVGGGGTATITQINVTLTDSIGVVTFPLVVNVSLNKSSGYAGCGLNNPGNYGRKPPKVYYKILSGTARLILTDGAANKFYVVLSATDWTVGSWGWSDFTPVVSGRIPTDQADITGMEFEPNSSSTDLQIYWVGTAPVKLPVPCYTYKTLVSNRLSAAHTWKVGTCEIKNSTLNILPYTPGVIPYTANYVGSTKVSWTGEPLSGYQSATMLQAWNLPTYVRQVALFWLASQDSYTNDSPSGLVGVSRQGYNWARWDALTKPPYNVFVDTGSDPNIRWEGYQHRMIHDAAQAWRNDTTNDVLSTVVMRFLRYIDAYWNVNGQPGRVPTDYVPPAQGNPTRLYTSPHGTALIMGAAIDANIAGGNRLITFRTIQRCYSFLQTEYVTSGTMAGSWTTSQPTFGSYKEYYPFWHSEIIRAYVKLWENKDLIRYPTCADWGI